MNQLHTEVKKRLELVTNRLNALEKEQKTLLVEQEGLQKLDSLYSHMPYDTITEERRITEILLHQTEKTSTKNHNRGGRKSKGISIYDELIEIIFTSNKNPLHINDIHTQLELLTENKLKYKNVEQILRKQISKNKIIRTAPATYSWVGGTSNAATTLPTGGRSET
jgi:chaperonin cofactor prefoldin